jgi:Ca-activated chloride channel family protein
MRQAIIAILMLVMVPGLMAEDYIGFNEKGNEAFRSGRYQEALDYYRRAEVDRPETPEIHYNHANALAETGSYEEAAENYLRALNSDDARLQAKAYYNSGNNNFLKEDYVKAIEAYQQSLDLDPNDLDAKYNLELARKRLREQMQRQPKDQQDQQQQQKQQDQQQQKNKQQQPENQEGEEQKQQQQQQDEQEEQQKDQKPKPRPDEMTPEDARRILRALEEADKENQENRQRFKAQGVYVGKDW